jgi:hypothetical protein
LREKGDNSRDLQVLTAIANRDVATLAAFANEVCEHSALAGAMAAVYGQATEPEWATSMLEWVWTSGHDPGTNRLIKERLPNLCIVMNVTPDISAEVPMSRTALGLCLAEMRQQGGDLAGAIDIVEQLDATALTALSLAELYLQSGRMFDVVELTADVTNQDDATSVLLTFRAAALRALDRHTEARVAASEAARHGERMAVVRHRALVQRALSYFDEQLTADALRDLEAVFAEDPEYPGLETAVMKLRAARGE